MYLCVWVGGWDGFLEKPALMPLSVGYFAIVLRIGLPIRDLPGKKINVCKAKEIILN